MTTRRLPAEIRAALDAMATQAMNVAIAILLIAVWLGLSAYLDAQPSETDALAASALDKRDALHDAIAAAQDRHVNPKGPR